MARPIRILSAALSLAALAGCAAPGPYPSLAVRPAERQYEAGDEERQPLARADSPAIGQRLAELLAEARDGDAEFQASSASARTAAARAGAPGSETWMEAQQALSRLEAARARTTRAVADLDAYALQQTNGGTLSAADTERLRAMTTELQTIADAQADRLNRLQAAIRSR